MSGWRKGRSKGIRQRHSQRGFTLVEVLIALFIFSLIAAGTVYALRLGIAAREQVAVSDDGLRQMQVMRLLIKDDLLQVLPRGVRDEFGNQLSNGLQGGVTANSRNFDDDTRILLRFVRNGWTNPGYGDPRPSIQFVEYVVREGNLIRRIRPFPDDARDQPITERIMLSTLDNVRVEFLSGFDRGEPLWIDRWPLSEAVGELNTFDSGPPVAINLVFDHPRFGTLNQRYWIGRYAGRG